MMNSDIRSTRYIYQPLKPNLPNNNAAAAGNSDFISGFAWKWKWKRAHVEAIQIIIIPVIARKKEDRAE